jgi:DNA topoisomerase-2
MINFCGVRLDFYEKRKMNLLNKLTEEWEKLDNKVRFIIAVVNGSLVVSNRKKAELLAELKSKGFKTFFPKKKNALSSGDDQSNPFNQLIN